MLASLTETLRALHALSPAEVPGTDFSEPWWRSRVDFIACELRRNRLERGFPADWLDHMERLVKDNVAALEEAPAAGVLHGDISWGNVLVDDTAVVGLIDFEDAGYEPAKEDALQILFETQVETTLWTEPARLQRLPGFDLSGDVVLQRHLIAETENILLLLTGELSWKTPAQARADAFETYREAFESDRVATLLEQLRA